VPGRSPTGSAAIEEAICSLERHSEDAWYLRVKCAFKGELFLIAGTPGAAAADEGQSGRADRLRAHPEGALFLGNCAPPQASPGLLRDHHRSRRAIAAY